MDDMTCKTLVDQAGNVLAKACASGDAKIKFDSNFENTYYTNTDFPAGNPYGEIVDKPWHQDLWDVVTNFWSSTPAVILMIITAGAFIWWIIDRSSWKDYAPDAWDAEDRIEELNAEADWRTQGSEDEDEKNYYLSS